MNIFEFGTILENLKDRELFHHVQRCVCLSLANKGDPQADFHSMLDLVYAECTRRGKERLYDQAYESVCREPQVCSTLPA